MVIFSKPFDQTGSAMVANIGHRDEMDDLPDQDVARDFYAKYEPKEVLGRYGRLDSTADE